ncbi:hypothetical protein F4604DRAFT_1297628 [Suillus subluteus]|nr:hypothetical protein F4604DRAFT_1297628 [Suillus subluteus]
MYPSPVQLFAASIVALLSASRIHSSFLYMGLDFVRDVGRLASHQFIVEFSLQDSSDSVGASRLSNDDDFQKNSIFLQQTSTWMQLVASSL